jgi:hypothetical protein
MRHCLDTVSVGLMLTGVFGCGLKDASVVGKRCDPDNACPNGHACVSSFGGQSACVESPCRSSSGCVAGYVCSGGACLALCNSGSDCPEGYACEQGLCNSSAAPRLTAVFGNGSMSCSQATAGRCFADGLIVNGENLLGAEFKLTGATTFSLPRSLAGEQSAARAALDLPADLGAGQYTLVAYNSAGSDQTAVNILQGEPGSAASCDALEARVAALEAGGVAKETRSSITVGPTGDYADLPSALASLDGKVIAASAKVTIQIQDGTYTLAAAISIRHPDGDRIEIIGNTSDPAAVTLNFNRAGIGVGLGGRLGRLAGVTVANVGVPLEGGAPTVGVVADAGYLSCARVVVTGYDRGFAALRGGTLSCWWAQAENNGAGFYTEAGYLQAGGLSATGNGIGLYAAQGGYLWAGDQMHGGPAWVANSTSDGVVAQGGMIWAPGATVSNSGGAGFIARNGGVIEAGGAEATTNQGAGFKAEQSATIVAAWATATANVAEGYVAKYSSTIDTRSSTATGNGGAAYSPTPGTLSGDGSYLIP